MNNFGLGNRQITENFEVTLPSGRKTPFTRAKTDYIRFVKQNEKSDFFNSPVALEKQLDMLKNLRGLAEKEKFVREFEWIDPTLKELNLKYQKVMAEIERQQRIRVVEMKKKATEDTVRFFANAYYQPFFVDTTAEEQEKEKLNPEGDLMQLLNSCKISETQFDPNAQVILNAYKDKTKDLYHLRYLIDKCRNEEDGLVNPVLAEGVNILASSGVNCSRAPQFLEENSIYDYETGHVGLNFSVLEEIPEFKSKLIEDVDIIKLQRFLGSDFEDRDKIKGFVFKFIDAGIGADEIIGILDALKYSISDEKIDIKDEAVDSILNLKKVLVVTRKNEGEERKNSPDSDICDIFQISDDTKLIRTSSGFNIEKVDDTPPEELKKRYETAIESIENNLLIDFAKKYKNLDGVIDSKYLRVATYMRNNGVVYKGIIPLIDLSFNREKQIRQSNLEAVKHLKEAKVLSEDVPKIIKSCPKNEDGSVNIEAVKDFTEFVSYGLEQQDIFKFLSEIKNTPEQKEFIINCSQLFDDKQKIFTLLELTKDNEGNIDKNAQSIVINLGFNIVQNQSPVEEEKMFEDIESVLNKVKDSTTGKVSDEAAGTCSILSQNGFNVNAIWNVLVCCEESSNKYNADLSEIVWKMALEKATPAEIVNVLTACRSREDHSILLDKTAHILELFNQGYKKDDIIAQLGNE